MKAILAVLLVATGLLFAGCSSEVKPDPKKAALLREILEATKRIDAELDRLEKIYDKDLPALVSEARQKSVEILEEVRSSTRAPKFLPGEEMPLLFLYQVLRLLENDLKEYREKTAPIH